MESLKEAVDAVEQHEKTLEVHSDDDDIVSELERQFSTRNVQVTHHPGSAADGSGFVIIRAPDGEFRAALSVDHLEALLSPEIHPPWELSDPEADFAEIFNFLDNTVFTSYTRRQMLATAREIEEKAWRTGAGSLYTGFQRAEALTAQERVYTELATHDSLTTRVFVSDEWDVELDDAIEVVTETADEIGQFWFVIYDGGGNDLNKSGLIAEERSPGQFYGFWTYDPEVVDEIVGYLRAEYGVS